MGDSQVYGAAKISGLVRICDESQLCGEVHISGKIAIEGRSQIRRHSRICFDEEVTENVIESPKTLPKNDNGDISEELKTAIADAREITSQLQEIKDRLSLLTRVGWT
jgi:UDP-3-O-[3-hydroxymyristoyl] glucosamine N-acyltransferase